MRPRGAFQHPTAPTQPPGCPRERATTCHPTLPSRARSTRDPRSWSASREGGLLTPAKDQRTAPLLLTLVCCRFRDRSTGPVGGCGATTGGWNSGRRQQEQAPGQVPWAAGSWPLAWGSARCACSSQPQAVCFGQQAGRYDALRRAEGELPGCSRRAAPAEPPGPSAAPDPRAEAESTKHAAF